ncbi:MAG TPA: hypothetical protein VGL11_09825 [Candidatus Binatia bacterium]|jgi:hypothetical protein
MNQKSLILIGAVAVGGLVLYYALAGRLAQFTKKPPAAPVAQLQAPPAVGQTGTAGTAGGKQKEMEDENASWGRNPFLTEAEAAKLLAGGQEGLRVKAIIMGPPKPVATIDGKAVVVGEKVGEATVVAINRDSVVLETDGTKRVLRMGEPTISIEATEGKRR